jgi:hypothetical protein
VQFTPSDGLDALYWRLETATGGYVNEDMGGSSIRYAANMRGASALYLVERYAGTIRRRARAVPGVGEMVPIWYRVRSRGLDGAGPRTEYIVFGWAAPDSSAPTLSASLMTAIMRPSGMCEVRPTTDAEFDVATVEQLIRDWR